MLGLDRKPEVLASTPDEDLSLAVTAEKLQEAPHQSHGDWTFLGPHERVPEVPVKIREGTQFYATTREKPGDSPLSSS